MHSWSEIKSETTRNIELRRENDKIREQIWTMGENYGKDFDRIHQLLATMAFNTPALVPLVETPVNKIRDREPGNPNHMYSRVEFPNFDREDISCWIYK